MTRKETFAEYQQFMEKYVDSRMIISYVDDVASNVERG